MKYKTSSLVIEAEQIKSFIEKKKKIPKAATLSTGETLSPYSISYLFSLMVRDQLKSNMYDLINVIVYNPSKRYNDTVKDKDVTSKDYLMMVENFIKFCKKYRRVPRFITIPSLKVKVSFELYLYCLCKIVLFIDKNNKLPNYCNFNEGFISVKQSSKETSKKDNNQSTSDKANTYIYVSKPHPTKKGCGGMGQDTSYYCGVSALQKVLYKFGIRDYSQKTLAGWAGTTTKGTSHQGIRTAVAKVNQLKKTNIKVEEKTFLEVKGWEGIAKILANPKKDIIFHDLYRLEYGHYEVVNQIDLKTGMLKVLNSLGNKCPPCYCGYVEDRRSTFMKQYMDGISQKSLIILTKG